jgi:hypothetical protein
VSCKVGYDDREKENWNQSDGASGGKDSGIEQKSSISQSITVGESGKNMDVRWTEVSWRLGLSLKVRS